MERRQLGGLARTLAARVPRRVMLGALASSGLALGAAGLAPASVAAQNTTEVGAAPVGQVGLEMLGQREQGVATPGPAATEVGSPPAGHISLEVVARIDQEGFTFSFFGYLTAISGLDEATLFTAGKPAARTAADARFTIVGAATMIARSVEKPLFVVDAQGKLTFHFNEAGGAKFDTGQGFSSGLPIAVASLRFQSIINVVAPKQGIFTGFGELSQVSATPFTLANRPWRLGHPGLPSRLTMTGQGKLLDPALPRATIVTTGNAVTIGTTGGG